MITYRLGGRRVKEITARGQALWIAIPGRPTCRPGRFARIRGLPCPILAGRSSAEQMELSVEPPCGPGLVGVLGAIQSRPSGLSWLVAAIVVQIRPLAVHGARSPRFSGPCPPPGRPAAGQGGPTMPTCDDCGPAVVSRKARRDT